MRSRRHCTDPRRRGGFILLESLVSMAIVALVVAASVYALGRGVNLQYAAGMRGQIVEQLRALIINQGVGLCSGSAPNVSVGDKSFAVSVSKSAPYCQGYANVTVTIPGAPAVGVTAPATQIASMQLSVTSPILGGTVTFTSD